MFAVPPRRTKTQSKFQACWYGQLITANVDVANMDRCASCSLCVMKQHWYVAFATELWTARAPQFFWSSKTCSSTWIKWER